MDTTGLSGTIIVGVDGSSGAMEAVDWAARQAALEHRPLTVFHSVGLLDGGATYWLDRSGVDPGALLAELAAAGQAILGEAAGQALRAAPGVEVRQALRHLDPRQALLQAAPHARMIVLGSRGRGPVSSLLLGSVSVSVSKHAACPVVVLRPRGTATGGAGIIVTTDGTERSGPVLEFAFRMASTRTQPLTVVHCFWDAVKVAEGARDVADDEPGLDDQRALLSESVAGYREKFPDVQVSLQLTRGFADHRLLEVSESMDLIVVGSQRIGLLADIVYGSLAPTVVEHAHCAVAVVPSPAHEAPVTTSG